MFDDFTANQHKFLIRREVVFLILSGIFLGSLTMLNILGVSKVLDFSFFNIPFIITVGVLPYPITFLCTDFISEIYGKRRAGLVVWVGLILNLWVLFILWVGGILPPTPSFSTNEAGAILPELNDKGELKDAYVFYKIREMTMATTMASMIAYLTAQFCDVHIFHYLKKLTKGKHMWLRNNGSTLISQLVDSIAVILIVHYFSDAFKVKGRAGEWNTLITLIFSGYVFKLVSALVDTIPFYYGTHFLKKYLGLRKQEEVN